MKQMTIFGNLGSPAKQESKDGGKPYLRFSVAVNSKEAGVDRVDWINVFTRQLGLLEYLTTGTAVVVSGRASWKTYLHNGSGQYLTQMTINASTIQLAGGGTRQAQQTTPSGPQAVAAQPGQVPTNATQLTYGSFPKEAQVSGLPRAEDTTEDDLPF